MLSQSYDWQFYSFSIVQLSSTVRGKCALRGDRTFLGANLKCETHYSLQSLHFYFSIQIDFATLLVYAHDSSMDCLDAISSC